MITAIALKGELQKFKIINGKNWKHLKKRRPSVYLSLSFK